MRALWLMAALCVCGCEPRSRTAYRPPPPPPCMPDGVYGATAQRTFSSGSVCNLQDLQQLGGEIRIVRTGFDSVTIDHQGKYSHPAHLDPMSCTVWTDRTPSYGRSVMGAKVSGSAAYRAFLRPDGALYGNVQLSVTSNTFVVPACNAAFQLHGRRVR